MPFYIAGGLLVAWALFVSIGLGMRSPDFPEARAAARGDGASPSCSCCGRSSMAVIISGGGAKRERDRRHDAEPAEAQPAPGTPPQRATPTGTTPTATTGTPAPASSPAAATSSRSPRTPAASSPTARRR